MIPNTATYTTKDIITLQTAIVSKILKVLNFLYFRLSSRNGNKKNYTFLRVWVGGGGVGTLGYTYIHTP